MIWCFKKAKLIYYGLFIMGLIFFMILSSEVNGKPLFPSWYNRINGILFVFIIIIWYLISTIVGLVYTAKRFKKINAILNDKCDPEEYIEILTKIINRKVKRKPKLATVLINISTGLIALDRDEEALSLLNSINSFQNINKFSKGRTGNKQRVYVISNKITLCFKSGNLEQAGDLLSEMKDLIITSKLSERFYFLYLKMLFLLYINNENFENTEGFFTLMFEKSETIREKIDAKLILGKIFIHYGRNNEAKEAFEYVIRNGNKFKIVDKAREFLELTEKLNLE